MARQNVQFIAFNRGIVSRYGLARVDLQRMRYSAEQQTNWIPRVLGSMMLRPGSGYQGYGTYTNAKSLMVPFIKATNDACFIEVSPGFCRFNVAGQFVTRVSVATTVTNGTFSGNITGWTVADQAGATSAYDAPNQLGQTGTGLNDAIAYQQVSVAGGDQPKEHALRILVTRGPVGLRIGTVLGLDDLQEETYLEAGQHSIAFTPNAASFYIYFFNRTAVHTDVSNCTIEPAGQLVLKNIWQSYSLPLLRWDQSADVLYIGDGNFALYQFERRSATSWSLAYYRPTYGPFRTINFSPTQLTPSAINGDITLAASSPTFNPMMAGALFKLSSLGQSTDNVLAGLNQATTPAIRVTGQGPSRAFSFNTIPSAWVGQLRLQVGQTAQGPWTNLGVVPVPTNDFVHNDGDDNQILYYQIIADAYTSGSVEVQMEYGGGSIDGYVRLLTYVDPQTFSAVVLSPLGNTGPTTLWYEGAWSFWRGWPTSNCLFEDRLWWFGLGQYWGSVSDAYKSFDDTVLGDSGPINRTIGKGPVDWVNWGLGLLRLLVGTDGTLVSARSDSLDTPLTPSNFNLKFPITQGAARIAAVNADDLGYFVHRNLTRVYELAFDTSNYIKLDYGATDMTSMCPEVCQPGIVRMAVQRQPDTRIHCVLSDGTVAIMVGEKVEQVTAWVKYDFSAGASGFVEDVMVLPQPGFEDAVWYIVRRTVASSTVRYYEKLSLESECVGGTLNKQADSFVLYSGAPANVLSAAHLIGQHVIVWGDGKDLSPGSSLVGGGAQKTYLVDGAGHVTLDAGVMVSNAVIGLPYQATFEGAKLAYAAQMGSALTQKKRVASIGLILADVHAQGLLYGPGLDRMDPMPEVVRGAIVPYDTVTEGYDDVSVTFPGEWDSDARLWLVAQAPRPCRVLAAVVDQITSEVIDGQSQGPEQG
jgi:hypothetical protein